MLEVASKSESNANNLFAPEKRNMVTGSGEQKMYKVIVAEDLAALRRHVRDVLTQTLGEVEMIEAKDGVEATELALSIKPDLVIMDVAMPVLNGIKAAQRIWEKLPRTRILFWSQYHREVYIRDLSRILPDEAIHGYVLKTAGDEKLAYAINCIVMYDNPYIDPAVRTIRSRLATKGEGLTDAEYETLLDIAVGMTDKAISLRRHISVRGVQNRVSLLFSKLLKGEDGIFREASGVEIINQRSRIVLEALKRGLIDTEEIQQLDNEFNEWFNADYRQER